MTFNKKYIKEKSNQFWEAYFLMLELKEQDIGKFVAEVPLVREVDIDEDYLLRVGRNAARWALVDKQFETEVAEELSIDDATRAFELLRDYLNRVV